ncbi:MAG: nucleotidyltransferase domain-containing protein [Phycisphaerae bacterium]|nr:nucleotidyltransferase domain-containing protein [Phycisphaerae bacterium]
MDRQTSVTTRKFAEALKKHMKVNLLILFGSRARGDNFVTSDYDFVLVSRVFSGKPFIRRASRLYKLWHSKFDLEVLCYTPEEWHRLKDKRGILLNAQDEGVRLL